jgi:hypothetical protein
MFGFSAVLGIRIQGDSSDSDDMPRSRSAERRYVNDMWGSSSSDSGASFIQLRSDGSSFVQLDPNPTRQHVARPALSIQVVATEQEQIAQDSSSNRAANTASDDIMSSRPWTHEEERDYIKEIWGSDDSSKVVVHATQGFPENKKVGFNIYTNLVINTVNRHGWAAQSADLGKFIGYRIRSVNKTRVNNLEEFRKVKATLAPGDDVVFVLEDVLHLSDYGSTEAILSLQN